MPPSNTFIIAISSSLTPPEIQVPPLPIQSWQISRSSPFQTLDYVRLNYLSPESQALPLPISRFNPHSIPAPNRNPIPNSNPNPLLPPTPSLYFPRRLSSFLATLIKYLLDLSELHQPTPTVWVIPDCTPFDFAQLVTRGGREEVVPDLMRYYPEVGRDVRIFR